MATLAQPAPQPNIPWIEQNRTPSLPLQQYFPQLDAAVRFLFGLISGSVPASVPLIAVAVPTNANAAAAGVAVGQIYRDTADPAKVYIRTV
jgi:hypothetical protein